jgi:hypothetical protein
MHLIERGPLIAGSMSLNPISSLIGRKDLAGPKLIVYVADGLLKPDNNAAENAIRPFVVVRKNWLFAGHPNGAAASATFFFLIGTAKANGLEPYAYLLVVHTPAPINI